MADEKTVEAQNNAQVRATVENKAPKPAGLLPKNTQQLVILGVAVVMVLIMWMTSGNKRVLTPQTASGTSRVQPPNPAAVEDFKQTIQQEQAATRQPISPSNLARLQALGLAGDVPPGGTVPPPEGTVPEPGGVIGGPAGGAPPPPPDPVKEDKKKREYLSLFATNVAFTSRRARRQSNSSARARRPLFRHRPHRKCRRILANLMCKFAKPRRSFWPQGKPLNAKPGELPHHRLSANKTQPALEQRLGPDQSRPGELNSAMGKRYVVFEGTVLETILINRLNGTFAGPVSCLVTTDIYSHDRQHVLIPAGTKVLGEAKKVEATGQQRLAVFFHRMIMPDGYSVSLDQFKGLNQIGETALRDKVNNHYLQIFGASLAVGILGGVAEAGTGNSFTSSPMDRAREGFGASLATSSAQILDHFLNILPTVTIREGNRVKVYLSGDLLLPDYTQHTMQSDL